MIKFTSFLHWLRSRSVPVLAAGFLLVTVVAASMPVDTLDAESHKPRSRANWGVYAGPGAKGVRGARAFSGEARARVSRVLDFLPGDSWQAMTNSDWLIKAHSRSGYHLELSVPLLPGDGESTLDDCAAGAYNKHWKTIANQLERAHLDGSTIRPGWEQNGDWYAWSALGRQDAYIGCFRQLVDTMRSVSGQFTFSWSVNVGVNPMRGELGWPGDDYVDIVGVDVYDYSTQWYPAPEGVSLDEARAKVWDWTLNGDHGLRYWSDFARQHHKRLAIPEWGLAWKADGHAGGDNTLFVDGMVAFIRDPANRVAYANYFNSRDTDRLKHRITGPDTAFPKASERFAQIASRR